MTNAQLVALLLAIRGLALVPYPFADDGVDRDPRLVLALGEIAGRAMRALSDTGHDPTGRPL